MDVQPNLEQRIDTLDNIIDDINTQLKISNLDLKTMVKVMICIANQYQRESINGPILNPPVSGTTPGLKVVYYDIGYRLIREQLEREWMARIPKERRTKAEIRKMGMFLDGVLGWVVYNGGYEHRRMMDQALRIYIESEGASMFRKNLRFVLGGYSRLVGMGQKARDQMIRGVERARQTVIEITPPKEESDTTLITEAERGAACRDMFTRSYYALDARTRYIQDKKFLSGPKAIPKSS